MSPPTSADADVATFTNSTVIDVPATGSANQIGPASPYPSTITVSGMTGTVTDVNVTLTNVVHTVTTDIDALLVGPAGQNLVLMSDAKGASGFAVNGTLTFDDAASGLIPLTGALATGTFQPTNVDTGVDTYPAPAPAPSSATALSSFNGTDPNGQWRLFVVDDATGDVGSIGGGWSITITTAQAVVAEAGGPYVVNEGSALSLDGSASTAGPTATFAWDLDNDAQFDDATGVTPTVSAATLAALGLGDGPAGPVTVGLQVTEGASVVTDSTTLTINNVAPIVAITNVPAGIVAGVPATLTFGATDLSAADQAAGFTYAIDWGDGTPAQSVTGGPSVSVTHTWATNGTFTVAVTATDKDAGTSSAATASVIVGASVVADAGGPYNIAEGGDLVLDGTGTTAGPTATFAWDVDNDGQFDDAVGASPSVAAVDLTTLGLSDGPSTHTVTLRVTEGVSVVTDSTTLTINNVAPIVAITSVPAGIVAGVPATLTFGATDPSGADQAAGFTYAIDWGDGTPAQSVTGGPSVSVTHTWATNGTFTVTVTATDKDGGSTTLTATATVAPAAPVVVADAGGPYSITEGDNLVLDGTGTSAGPTAAYAWDLDADGIFDDASGATATLTPTELDALHLADGPTGPLTFTLRVTEGPTVGTDTAPYSISNAPPVATIDLPATIVAGTPATVKVGATDPSPTDAAADFEYRIDWDGDGTVDDVITGPADPNATHTYSSAGDVALTVIAVDKDGAASAPTVTQVTVEPAATPTTPPTTPTTPTTTPTAPGAGTALPRTGGDTDTSATLATALLIVGVGLAGARRRALRRHARRSSA